jgi:hypothetical protein
MTSRVDKFKDLVQNESLTVKEMFSIMSVEQRDEFSMMHIKTLGKDDALTLVDDCYRGRLKRRSKKRSKRIKRSKRTKNRSRRS